MKHGEKVHSKKGLSHRGKMHEVMESRFKLHVVLHGLICVRLSELTRTVQLFFPSVSMHDYHFGSFRKPKPLSTGHDYELGGVRVGHLQLGDDHIQAFGEQHLLISEQGSQVKCQVRGTHATVTLPWPESINGVRQISNPTDPLFDPASLNPQRLRYVSYITYSVGAEDQPVLTDRCKTLWSSEALTASTRLHFYADPTEMLEGEELRAHLEDAYKSFNDQVFAGRFPVVPNVPDDGWKFDDQGNSDIPPGEAVDFIIAMGSDGSGGNCLPPFIVD